MAEAEKAKAVKEIYLEEKASEAFMTLAEIAARMKETGLLDLLAVLAENYDELVAMAANSDELYAATQLARSALRGAAAGKPDKAAPTVERAAKCLIEALDEDEIKKAKPIKGLIGLVRALSDPGVARGLGLLIHIAGKLGRCLPVEER